VVHPLAIGVIACAVGPGGNEVSGAIALSPARLGLPCQSLEFQRQTTERLRLVSCLAHTWGSLQLDECRDTLPQCL